MWNVCDFFVPPSWEKDHSCTLQLFRSSQDFITTSVVCLTLEIVEIPFDLRPARLVELTLWQLFTKQNSLIEKVNCSFCLSFKHHLVWASSEGLANHQPACGGHHLAGGQRGGHQEGVGGDQPGQGGHCESSARHSENCTQSVANNKHDAWGLEVFYLDLCRVRSLRLSVVSRKSSLPAGRTTWETGPPSLSWPTCWRSCPNWTAGSPTRDTSGSLQSRYPWATEDVKEQDTWRQIEKALILCVYCGTAAPFSEFMLGWGFCLLFLSVSFFFLVKGF